MAGEYDDDDNHDDPFKKTILCISQVRILKTQYYSREGSRELLN